MKCEKRSSTSRCGDLSLDRPRGQSLHHVLLKPEHLRAAFAYGGYPDLDGLFREQAGELDRAKREAVLRRLQQLFHERAIVAPIYELAFGNGVGRRVEEAGLGLIAGDAFSAPYEDVKLKAR
jgi:hypothetical protein